MIRWSLLWILTLSFASISAGEIQRRAAFDIGSGQVKVQVSDVDVDENKIVAVFLQDLRWVPLREDLARNGNIFSQNLQEHLVKAVEELMTEASAFNPAAYHAIASESFRRAQNGQELVDRLKEATGLTVTIVSQQEEGVLGFLSAINEAQSDPQKAVVWDFGAGSFQLTTLAEEGYVVYHGKLGKVPFKEALVQLKGKNPGHTLTPNPITILDIVRAIQIVEKNVCDVPPEIMKKLQQHDVAVLGIGIHPLWSMGNQDNYTRGGLIEEILARKGLDDCGLKMKDPILKEPPPYIVSNLLLAYGVMKTLHIKRVKYVGKASANAIGTLLSPQYWK